MFPGSNAASAPPAPDVGPVAAVAGWHTGPGLTTGGTGPPTPPVVGVAAGDRAAAVRAGCPARNAGAPGAGPAAAAGAGVGQGSAVAVAAASIPAARTPPTASRATPISAMPVLIRPSPARRPATGRRRREGPCGPWTPGFARSPC